MLLKDPLNPYSFSIFCICCRNHEDRKIFDCNFLQGNDQTPLLAAVMHGHCQVVHSLLEARAECDRSDWFGRSPLLLASSTGDLVRGAVEQFISCVAAYKEGSFAEAYRASVVKNLTTIPCETRNSQICLVSITLLAACIHQQPSKEPTILRDIRFSLCWKTVRVLLPCCIFFFRAKGERRLFMFGWSLISSKKSGT